MSKLRPSPWLMLGLLAASTIIGLSGTDLILPAIPSLPDALGGDAADAQMVLAAYAAGTALGLIAYGMLADRFRRRRLFLMSLLLTGAVSFACAHSSNIGTLIALRIAHGVVAAGPAVFVPGIILSLFDDARAVRAIGIVGSAEGLAPALAPILGVWLVSFGGWRVPFETIGVISIALTLVLSLFELPAPIVRRGGGSYGRLLTDPVFLRYALSQAFVLGGLITFVFGMPAVFVRALGGTLTDFIIMQVCGVASFMLAANLVGGAVARFGPERVIGFGTGLAAFGASTILVYALTGATDPRIITALFVILNTGLGVRGPPGFLRAIIAAQGDDARGAALVILAVMAVAAAGTAAVAPFIERGLVPLAALEVILQLAAVTCLAALPRLAPD